MPIDANMIASILAAPTPAGMNDYAMYPGDPYAISKMAELLMGRQMSDEERQFGATAYGQDYQKRNEAMQIPTGPFGLAGLDQRRAIQEDQENNMLLDGRQRWGI